MGLESQQKAPEEVARQQTECCWSGHQIVCPCAEVVDTTGWDRVGAFGFEIWVNWQERRVVLEGIDVP